MNNKQNDDYERYTINQEGYTPNGPDITTDELNSILKNMKIPTRSPTKSNYDSKNTKNETKDK